MVGSASIDGVQLFLDGDVELDGGMEALLYAIMDGAAGGQKGELPKWLTQGMAQEGLTPEQILSELGLDKDASASDILRAIAGRPLESDPVPGRGHRGQHHWTPGSGRGPGRTAAAAGEGGGRRCAGRGH